MLFRTALRILMNREEAEDVVQDVLVRLWQMRDELATVKNIEAFALTTARNLALDRKALHSNRVVSLDEQVYDHANDSISSGWGAMPDRQLIAKEGTSYITQLIDALPEKQRTVLHLRDIEGRTYREIADMLSISEADVKVSLFRARGTIKAQLKTMDD